MNFRVADYKKDSLKFPKSKNQKSEILQNLKPFACQQDTASGKSHISPPAASCGPKADGLEAVCVRCI